MVLAEVKFKDGSKIYYEPDGVGYCRKIYYATTGEVESAGKYYYLRELYKYRDIGAITYKNIKTICDLTTGQYNKEVAKKLCRLFREDIYQIGDEVFFMAVYLAMVDLEAEKLDSTWPGKKLVLYSCKAVLLDNMSYEEAAVLK